ncbi:MAG: class I SAM-dependent methyltransferase [Woeseiaceae bacterium]
MKTLRTALLVSAALSFVACGDSATNESATTPPEPVAEEQVVAVDLATLLAARSEEDRARDAGRKPAEVIAAMGIEPGMNVLDVIAAGGWYTEVLSAAVGSEGSVTAHNPPRVLQFRDGANEVAISARLADGRLANVTRLNKDTEALTADDGQFDAALTALNLHDVYNRGGDEVAVTALAAVYSTLKPGGFFVVIDHEGIEGNDNAELHRMVKADAVRVGEAAGFVLETDSGVLHHHSDDMSLHMRDESVQGKTHRFVLKFRKPE